MFEAFIIDELLKQDRRRDELERERLRPRLELPVPEMLEAPERAPAEPPEAAETGRVIVIDLG